MDLQQVQALIDAAVAASELNLQQQLTAARNDLVTAQNQINVLTANAAAPAVPVPPAPAVNVTFAYTPGTTGPAASLLDYSTTNGAKIQRAAIEKLPVVHDLDKEHMYDFLEALRSRAIACNWYGTLFQIPQDGELLNPIVNYGVLKKTAVDTKVKTYMFHNTREAQDDYNLFSCLEASLSTEARATLYAESAMYTYNITNVPNATVGVDPNEQRRSGLMYLWTIINRTTAMTTATISVLLEQLNNLPSVMQEVNNDVTAFNSKVRKILTSYYANKRESYNETALLHNLAKAYSMCKDDEFVTYMKRKWSDHEDGTKTLDSQEIMEFALKKYQTSVEEHSWGTDSKQMKSIMNLSAKVGSIQKWQSAKDKAKNTETAADTTKLTAAEYRKLRFEKAPAWMKKAPTDPNKINKKDVKGIEYTWCRFHKMWVKHDASTCRLNPAYKPTSGNSTNSTSPTVKTSNTDKSTTVSYKGTTTMMAVVNADSDSDI